MTKRYLITGGAGFIGSAVARKLIQETLDELLIVDKLTYAGNLESLAPISTNPRFRFERADIVDSDAMQRLFKDFAPDVVMHLAAESHVDRSIDGPQDFLTTNVLGTFTLLQCALDHWRSGKTSFRFHHISTDEVYGSLGATGLFTEDTPYQPNSPYSATKAASDHLVRAWHHTYGLPVVVTNCSNNYGPYHFPEKLIPLTIINGLEGKPIPVYGRGENVRDWLHVEDHADALLTVAGRGVIGESYNVGGNAERNNLSVVTTICDLLDELAPNATIGKRSDLISFVSDRPGHDLRYAIDAGKIASELNWKPKHSFETGLRQTVKWYLDNRAWWEPLRLRYEGNRLGLAEVQSNTKRWAS